MIGNSYCNDETNTANCNYDGGNCCININTNYCSECKCYYKQNGETRWGCGFTDKSLIDDDETEIKTVTVDDTTVFYVSKKHHED